MTDLSGLLLALQSDPSDPLTLLAYADALDELAAKPEVAYACRWMASRRKYPALREDLVRPRWWWGRTPATKRRRDRKKLVSGLLAKHPHASLPDPLYENLPRQFARSVHGIRPYRTVLDAVEALARALSSLRAVVNLDS